MPVASLDGMRSSARLAVALAVAAAGVGVHRTRAHEPFPSPFTYNDDVYPILAAHCGRCHVEDGAAPMPLTTWDKVRPWSEAIGEQLMLRRMPPQPVDRTGPAIVGPPSLTPRELDMVLTWAAGGAPEGTLAKAPPRRTVDGGWALGPPDVTLTMPATYTMSASRQDATLEFDLPPASGGERWLRAADLMPGTRSMVRDAQIAGADGRVLALWVAGEAPTGAPPGTAFRIAAGETLRLRIHYRKSWQDGPVARSDRSTIGLYFAAKPAPAREIRSIGTGRLVAAGRVLAVRPFVRRRMASVDVSAVAPRGARVTLLRLRDAEPGWPRRYWLAAPLDLQPGSRIVVAATAAPGESDDVTAAGQPDADVALDIVTP